MADSEKNICYEKLDLIVFPRNLLRFGFHIVIVFPSVCTLNVVLAVPFGKSCCYMETS